MSETIPPQQDRDLDYKTYQMFCVGCPFVAKHSNTRNPNSNGITNAGSWGGMTGASSIVQKSGYYCISPKATFNQMIRQEHTVTGAGGWCPMFDARWDTLNDKES